MIAIKWGESTHFPGRNNSGRIDPGRNDPVPFYVVLFKLYFLMITMLYMAMKMIGKIKYCINGIVTLLSCKKKRQLGVKNMI